MDMKARGKEKEEDQGQGGWKERWWMTEGNGEESSMTFTATPGGGTSLRKRNEVAIKIFALQLVTHLSITISNIMS